VQFYEYVVLQHLRPILPAGMPADYQLLMQSCWASSPADRPSIVRVLDCLDAMIEERALQAAAEEVEEAEAADDVMLFTTAAAEGPLRASAEFEDACFILTPEQQQQHAAAPAAAAGASFTRPSFAAAAAGAVAGAEQKRKKRSALLALLSPSGSRQRRSSNMQTHIMHSAGSGCSAVAAAAAAAAAVSPRDCNSEPLPPVLTSSFGGRGGSASSQRSGYSSYNARPSSETWLLQRSPASFSAGYGNAAFCVFSSSFSTSTNPPLLMVGDFEVEEEGSSCVSEAEAGDAAAAGAAAAAAAVDGGVGSGKVYGVAGESCKDDVRKAVAASTAEDYFWVV
jgi:hypothetical protein